MLAVGTRFGEIATGSYGWTPPASLIHVDINPAVFSANYPAAFALEGDAQAVLKLLLQPWARLPLPLSRAPRAGRRHDPRTKGGVSRGMACATTRKVA